MFNGKPSLPAPNLGSLPSAAVRPLARVTSFEDAILTAENDSLLDPATVMPGCLSSIPEDIGLPPDGLWDYDAAYEQRYCYIHGEFEYLLTTPDRWLSSNDLKMLAAEARLENLLQKDRIDPAIFDPYARRCQAECCSSIYSQIHSITDKREVSSVILYRARFKAFWTPGSDIEDKDRLEASLKTHQRWGCRRSARLAQTFGARKKIYEQVMMVVNLG